MFNTVTIQPPAINELKGSPDSQRIRKFPARQWLCLTRPHREVLPEDVFQGILCYERRRAERSGKTVLLMLMNVERLLQANQSQRPLSEIASALNCSTRITDITGWYREGATLGVVFTGVRETDRSALESLIPAKVTDALRARAGVEQADQINFSFHIFPEVGYQAKMPTCRFPRSGAEWPTHGIIAGGP